MRSGRLRGYVRSAAIWSTLPPRCITAALLSGRAMASSSSSEASLMLDEAASSLTTPLPNKAAKLVHARSIQDVRSAAVLRRNHSALVERTNRRSNHAPQAPSAPNVWPRQYRSASGQTDRRRMTQLHQNCVRAKIARRNTLRRLRHLQFQPTPRQGLAPNAALLSSNTSALLTLSCDKLGAISHHRNLNSRTRRTT
jgi:hypothetical protein